MNVENLSSVANIYLCNKDIINTYASGDHLTIIVEKKNHCCKNLKIHINLIYKIVKKINKFF